MNELVARSKADQRLGSKNTALKFCDQSVVAIPSVFGTSLELVWQLTIKTLGHE